MTQLGWNSLSNGFMNEVWDVGRVVTQKPYLSDQVVVVYTILNQDISLFASNLYYLLTSAYIKCIYQANLVYLLLSWTKLYISKPSAILKPVSVTYFRKGHSYSFNYHHQILFFCNLIYLIVDYFTLIYISNLITFINSVLKLYWNTQVIYTV